MTMNPIFAGLVIFLAPGLAGVEEPGRPMEELLLKEDPGALANAVRGQGDPARGAAVFYQPFLSCTKCHAAGDGQGDTLGPDLAKLGKEVTDAYLIESVLRPSKVIKKGFETVTIATADGKNVTGLLAEERADRVILRDPAQDGKLVTVSKRNIDERTDNGPSVMPAGLVNGLASRQQFLDLIRYLREIADGGPERAKALRPDPSQVAGMKLPDYESKIDHAGMIADLGLESLERGEAIYNRVCVNCHGTKDKPGSMPTSLRFASGRFKNGSDPYSLYRTLTHGFGQMPPQTWMVPSQKYDVIHYVRETFLKTGQPDPVRPRGPGLSRPPAERDDCAAPSHRRSSRGRRWTTARHSRPPTRWAMTGGTSPTRGSPSASMRGPAGSLGAGTGRSSTTTRCAWRLRGAATASSTGTGSTSTAGTRSIPGSSASSNSPTPSAPAGRIRETGTFDDPRQRGRDGRPYGPLPRSWAHYRGQYRHGDQVILAYTVGNTDVLETPGVETGSSSPVFSRTFNIGPRDKTMVLQVARRPRPQSRAAESLRRPGRRCIRRAPRRDCRRGRNSACRHPGRHLAPVSRVGSWSSTAEGDLRLTIPAGENPLRFTLKVVRVSSDADAKALASSITNGLATNLAALTRGGPARWPEVLKTAIKPGRDDGPFAVDTLGLPENNPWLCQLRLTGFDFLDGGRRAAVCTWDGDVWLVSGLDAPSGELSWKRIASGLFQPLGLKVRDGNIFVGCRDQIVILRDSNGDGETDFYENFNSDHQVTEHFHEFAMGLQTDADGNFYYAKAARHGKTALVPQHGTLLRVSRDGLRTDILATGFRAPTASA